MRSTSIVAIRGEEVLDSRGNPTVRTTVTLKGGAVGVATVPSGASTGTHEALELRDGGTRYGGKGVLKAVGNVNGPLFRALKGIDALDIRKIDETMIALDGTKEKKKLGANAILSVSLATAVAGAVAMKRPLYSHIRQVYQLREKGWKMPTPTMNVINGGRHADNGLSIQEFMIVPSHRLFRERVRIGAEVFHTLQGLLQEKGYTTGVGDEGGFAPELRDNEAALVFLVKAIKAAGYTPGKHVSIAMDWAASEFYQKGKYYFAGKRVGVSSDALISKFGEWMKKYPIVSIEDPLAEDDWSAWETFTKQYTKQVHIVGDDLFVTNRVRLKEGIERHVGNAILIKVNQIGTLSETIDTILLAKKNGYAISISHRSAETADTFIADLAVATNAHYIKTGSLSRSERVEKYNRLMAIEREIIG